MCIVIEFDLRIFKVQKYSPNGGELNEHEHGKRSVYRVYRTCLGLTGNEGLEKGIATTALLGDIRAQVY